MAYFRSGAVTGQFIEYTYNHVFEYRPVDEDSWGLRNGFPYEIAIGDLGDTRYAKVLKTVVYVVIDQDENGDPIVDKWKIKKHLIF